MIDNLKNQEELEVEKIKVTKAEIVVRGTVDKPYYVIVYHEVGKDYDNEGFGSYCLENVFKWRNEELEIVDENEQPKTDWIPCEVGDLIDKAFSHNEIVALWIEEATEDVRYDKQIWRGMAWDIPKVYKECKFIKIFGTVPESIVESDTINIRIELSEEAKLSLQRKETREPITPAYAYKKEGNSNENT